jgi:hypothetical protein
MGALRPIGCLTLALLWPAAGALAADTDTVMAKLSVCHAEVNDKRRLACFDALTQSVLAADITNPAATAVTQPANQANFGLSAAVIQQQNQALNHTQAEPPELTATITTLTHLPDRRLQIRLANGQVWEQVTPVTDEWIASGQTVTIKSAALGSYNLKNARGMVYKVHRVAE